MNFSAYLGHPESVHVAPLEKGKPGSYVKRKPKTKSKKKTERDNVRAARFQAKKRQDEKDAAAPEASKDDPLPTTSSPRAPGPSTLAFAEPTPENVTWVRIAILPTWTLMEMQPFLRRNTERSGRLKWVQRQRLPSGLRQDLRQGLCQGLHCFISTEYLPMERS